MARKQAKKSSPKATTNRHREIESEYEDPFERAAHVQEETSSDGKFSEYERVQVPGGELILQYRGSPAKD